jgi:hypothetical protein
MALRADRKYSPKNQMPATRNPHSARSKAAADFLRHSSDVQRSLRQNARPRHAEAARRNGVRLRGDASKARDIRFLRGAIGHCGPLAGSRRKAPLSHGYSAESAGGFRSISCTAKSAHGFR